MRTDKHSSKRMNEISVQECNTQLADDTVLLVDVRSSAEFKERYIDGSVNIPLDEIADRVLEVKGFDSVNLICRTGARSSLAQFQLTSAGIKHVHNVQGGIHEWVAQGLPVV